MIIVLILIIVCISIYVQSYYKINYDTVINQVAVSGFRQDLLKEMCPLVVSSNIVNVEEFLKTVLGPYGYVSFVNNQLEESIGETMTYTKSSYTAVHNTSVEPQMLSLIHPKHTRKSKQGQESSSPTYITTKRDRYSNTVACDDVFYKNHEFKIKVHPGNVVFVPTHWLMCVVRDVGEGASTVGLRVLHVHTPVSMCVAPFV